MLKIEFFGYFGILDSLYNSKFNEICVVGDIYNFIAYWTFLCTHWKSLEGMGLLRDCLEKKILPCL